MSAKFNKRIFFTTTNKHTGSTLFSEKTGRIYDWTATTNYLCMPVAKAPRNGEKPTTKKVLIVIGPENRAASTSRVSKWG